MTRLFPALILLSVIMVVAAAIGFKMTLGTCIKEDVREVASPTNEHEASIFVSSCGATVSDYTDVEVDGKRVFSVKYRHLEDIKINWLNDGELAIEYSGNPEDLFVYKEFYKDLRIKLIYVEKGAESGSVN